VPKAQGLLVFLCTVVIAFPVGGGPQAEVGEYGNFMGTLQQISALVVGEMWGLRFLNALLSGRTWGLGNWEGSIIHSRRRRRYSNFFNRDKFRTAYKLLGIEKVDFLKKYSQEC